MRLERAENSIGLVPETQFEIDCLKELRTREIISKEFDDAWNQRGALYINFRDKNDWGR